MDHNSDKPSIENQTDQHNSFNKENLETNVIIEPESPSIKIGPRKRGRKKKIPTLPTEKHTENIEKLVENISKIDKISVEVVKRGRKKTIKEDTKRVATRKERLMHFLTKNQFQLLYPDLRAFKNKKHAIECLLPYHILQDYEEKDEFLDSEIKLDVLDRAENLMVGSMDNVVLDILRCEELKYLLYKIKNMGEKYRCVEGVVRFFVSDMRIRIYVDKEML